MDKAKMDEKMNEIKKYCRGGYSQILVGLSIGILGPMFAMRSQAAAKAMAMIKDDQQEVVDALGSYERKVVEVDTYKPKRVIKRYSDIYDMNIDWMPYAIESQIMDSFNEYQETIMAR